MRSRFRFSLNISSDDYLRYYRGEASMVQVTADDGRRIRFPAANLRPFVSREGVQGRFEITLDKENRLQDLKKLR
jgi:uncharacterized radical SAM superfamily Fe-S cluster-containing enzyme